jgi:SAM-dependent methyltransferase
MKECSKSIPRRMRDPGFLRQYFVGDGVDIGGKPDPLALYREFFPGIRSVKTWDLEDGDAQEMAGVADATWDFVHSSHCLEHLRDPHAGLRSWLRVLKPGGHLVVTVPDEDLYEQGVFPSTFNRDHKWTFTIRKAKSWSERSINVLDLVASLGEESAPVKVELLDASYRYELPRFDQTLTPVSECGIELVIRKRPSAELAAGGRIAKPAAAPAEAVPYFNQYKDDYRAIVELSKKSPPFERKDPL